MTVYEAFCGIGGFSLGFQRAGFEIVGGCELDPYARAIYKKNFGIKPDGDIRTIGHVSADVICGGFPCQPFSVAGLRSGTKDERYLWPEMFRLIRVSRPHYVVLENVPGLLTLREESIGTIYGNILRDLASCGYDAEWDCLPASAFGAPHQRDRVWVVAYSNCAGIREQQISERRSSEKAEPFSNSEVSNTAGNARRVSNGNGAKDVSDTESIRSEAVGSEVRRREEHAEPELSGDGWKTWAIEPAVGRVVNGIPYRSHRLRCLGNAIVPQIAQWIAERIKEVEMNRE